MWTAFTTAHSWGSGLNKASIKWCQIRAAGPTVVQQGVYGTSGLHYFYPACCPDNNGNVTIVFSRSGPSEFGSIRYTGRRATDLLGTLQASTLLKAGSAHYARLDDGGRNRWGDYNGVAADPANPRLVWFYSEYAAAPDTWARGWVIILLDTTRTNWRGGWDSNPRYMRADEPFEKETFYTKVGDQICGVGYYKNNLPDTYVRLWHKADIELMADNVRLAWHVRRWLRFITVGIAGVFFSALEPLVDTHRSPVFCAADLPFVDGGIGPLPVLNGNLCLNNNARLPTAAIENKRGGPSVNHYSASFVRRHETQLTMRSSWILTPKRRATLEGQASTHRSDGQVFLEQVMNEADVVTNTHAAKIDALNELAASLIRSGAPVDAVQKFVDAEIDRIEFMQDKNR